VRSQNYEKRLLASSCLSVCSAVRLHGTTRLSLDGFNDIRYVRIFHKSHEKIQVSLKSDKNKGILHEDQYTFLIISRSVLLRMRNISDKSCRENQNIHFVFGNFPAKIVPFIR